MVLVGVALAGFSVLIFGWSVHQVYVFVVLPRALHGDLVGPYVLQWNSFTALCHRFFLAEPEMNPAPWMNSPAVYAVVQASIWGSCCSVFCSRPAMRTLETTAWEWATFLPLLILLSSMPTAYHHCVLILTMAVTVDWLLKAGRWRSAGCLHSLCGRVLSSAGIYLARFAGTASGSCFSLCTALNPGAGEGESSIAQIGIRAGCNILSYSSRSRICALYADAPKTSRGGFHQCPVVMPRSRRLVRAVIPFSTTWCSISECRDSAPMVLPEASAQPMPAPGDVLSVAATPLSPFVYFELTNQRSQIYRLPASQLGHADAVPEYVAEGRDPAISPDGRVLAFLRDGDTPGETASWLKDESSKDGVPAFVPSSKLLAGVLEVSVNTDGSLIVSAGGAARPRLFLIHTASGELRPLTEISGDVRYPALSADGKFLAFSRRESGAWHLFARDVGHGVEQRMTSGACNATEPAWEDLQNILYVSDCGRGLGLGAAVRVAVRR